MPKNLLRFVALFLVPCLIADQASAVGWVGHMDARRSSLPTVAAFAEQAFQEPQVQFPNRPIRSVPVACEVRQMERRGFLRLGLMGIGVATAGLAAYLHPSWFDFGANSSLPVPPGMAILSWGAFPFAVLVIAAFIAYIALASVLCWRLRVQPGGGSSPVQTQGEFEAMLSMLAVNLSAATTEEQRENAEAYGQTLIRKALNDWPARLPEVLSVLERSAERFRQTIQSRSVGDPDRLFAERSLQTTEQLVQKAKDVMPPGSSRRDDYLKSIMPFIIIPTGLLLWNPLGAHCASDFAMAAVFNAHAKQSVHFGRSQPMCTRNQRLNQAA